eukprot:TRINITY_DN2628_c0_g1_i1.p1 TRINITY_DN2628_c0_g1~~TRINITY_DN2628_c0_g1_i1.p1  ORF type:complete len:392 (+),score=23.80 TRINITY_DN2628_c0_g1_i1:15-1190(+)
MLQRKSELVVCLLLVLWMGSVVPGQGEDSAEVLPPSRARLIFNIIKFENDPCGTGDMIGTCYTSDECESRGGTSSESCASGYGTCCTFSLACGGTTSENSTYLTSSAEATSCSYKICKCRTDVCRIRLDFQSFILNGPVAVDTNPNSYGSCNTDSFVVSGATRSSPLICGFNTGQHMIVDAQDGCNMALFNLGSVTGGITRTWSINVTQYVCGDEYAGSPGCLQYITDTSGIVSSFNYNPAGVPVHLVNQDYNVCFRRASGNCRICYSSLTDGATETFGVGLSPDKTTANSGTNSDCTTDYLEIPSGVQLTDTTITTLPGFSAFRNCGRFLNAKRNIPSPGTVCSFAVPFRFRFVTDGTEALAGTGPDTKETKINPSGVIGYRLFYQQMAC